MENKASLNEKAIDIKGKKYVLVADRILYFNENYPNGMITTFRTREERMEVIKATVTPDVSRPERFFNWHSQAIWGDGYINKTSALENAETSAVWRALALMWIWVIDSIASVDEITKAKNTEKQIDSKKDVWTLWKAEVQQEYKCKDCWAVISEKIYKFKDMWLCFWCQKKHSEIKETKVEIESENINDIMDSIKNNENVSWLPF